LLARSSHTPRPPTERFGGGDDDGAGTVLE
jgi:hypothetical protein